MTPNLRLWLRQEAAFLCGVVLERLPSGVYLDQDDLLTFVRLLANNVDAGSEMQLTAVQMWALTSIGQDAPRAYDWLTALRTLKEAIGRRLDEQMPTAALNSWRMLDDIITYATIEASQLAMDMVRADLLQQITDLRSQKEAFEQSKSNFIAVAAHELKTPLTILEGYANMLRVEIEDDSKLQLYIEGLGNGFRRMHEIIGDMIDVSLIDLDSVQLKLRPINLEKMVLLVADSVDKYFQERRVELYISPFYVEAGTYGDEEKLAKALSKVLLNALKYTPDFGQVQVSAAFVRQDEATDALAGYVDIQVSDSGIGIASENLTTIFNKFTGNSDTRLHSSSKTKFKGGGPGLGLAIVKGIVEGHDGRVWAESPGYSEEKLPGSTFHIELPIWVSDPTA